MEAAELRCQPGILREALHFLGQSQANIATYSAGHGQALEHLAHDGSGSGLAIGAGDGRHMSIIYAVGHLYLADDLYAADKLCQQHIHVVAGHAR